MTAQQRRFERRSTAIGLARVAPLATARTATIKTGPGVLEESNGDGTADELSVVATLEEPQATLEDGKAVTTASATTGGGQ